MAGGAAGGAAGFGWFPFCIGVAAAHVASNANTSNFFKDKNISNK